MAKQSNLASSLDVIKLIFHNNFYSDDQQHLKEKNKDDSGKAFEMVRQIVSHRIDYALYRFDPDEREIFPFFSNSEGKSGGLRKICDYILFAEEQEHLYIILIELKLGTASATKQLIASECFVSFIENTARRLDYQLTPNVYKLKVRICEERSRRGSKGSTKPKDLKPDVNGILNYDHPSCFRIKEVISSIYS